LSRDETASSEIEFRERRTGEDVFDELGRKCGKGIRGGILEVGGNEVEDIEGKTAKGDEMEMEEEVIRLFSGDIRLSFVPLLYTELD